MQEVGVTRCDMEPEMAKFYRIFEYSGHLICLKEAPANKSGFYTDINEICWITETGERKKMTNSEKTEIISELKKWNKHAKRQGKMVVGFVDTRKGFYSLNEKKQDKLMKKLLMGLGIGIVAAFAMIGIGNLIATNMMPEYLAPIRVMSGGLMILTLIIPFMILLVVGVSFKDKKGKINKSVLATVLGVEMVWLVISLWAATRSIGAIADMINGPTEKVVYYALIKEDRDWGYRRGYSTEYYLEAVSIEGETREKLRLRVISEDLEEVEKVLAEAKWDYDIRAKYILRYFENIDIVFEIEAIPLE